MASEPAPTPAAAAAATTATTTTTAPVSLRPSYGRLGPATVKPGGGGTDRRLRPEDVGSRALYENTGGRGGRGGRDRGGRGDYQGRGGGSGGGSSHGSGGGGGGGAAASGGGGSSSKSGGSTRSTTSAAAAAAAGSGSGSKRKRIYPKEFLLRFRDKFTDIPKQMEQVPGVFVANLPALLETQQGLDGTPISDPEIMLDKSGKGSKLTRAANAWLPSVQRLEFERTNNSNQARLTEVKGMLNKLTIEKFDTLSHKILEAILPNVEMIREVARMVHEKAIREPNFAEMYARLCSLLNKDCSVVTYDGTKFNYRNALLDICEEEFRRVLEIPPHVTEPAEIEEFKTKFRKQKDGNAKFMGEITKNGLLPKKIIHQCINALLNIHKPVELDIEVLCTLIRSSGVCIDLPEHKGHMDDYFQRIKLLSQNKSLSARIRFKLEDLIELRENNWEPRRKEDGPKTLREIHKTAIEEDQRAATESQNITIAPTTRPTEIAKPTKAGPTKGSAVDEKHFAAQSLQAFEKKLDEIFEEFFSSLDQADTVAQIRELRKPDWNDMVVAHGVQSGVAQNEQAQNALSELFVVLWKEAILSPSHFTKGFRSVLLGLADLELDVPNALKHVAAFIKKAAQSHCLNSIDRLLSDITDERIRNEITSTP